MRILFIHNRYKQRGGEDAVVDMEAGLLLQKGHAVRTLLFDNSGIESKNKIRSAFRAVYNRAAAGTVQQEILQFRPDIIHVHNLFFIASPAVLTEAKKHGIPVVLTLHNYRLICANALLLRENQICELCVNKIFPVKGIQYKCYRSSSLQTAMVTAVTGIHKKIHTWQNNVDVYIALTAFARQKFLHSSLALTEEKIIVKPNFTGDPETGSWPRENFFLFAGRITAEKGIETALKAFIEMPDMHLMIAGGGPDIDQLKQQYGTAANIHFLGNKEKTQVTDLMKRCKALIFPSIWLEGMPLTIIEAFSTGTPVIASRQGAMSEMINDGYNGYHFETGNFSDLKDCIRKFESRERKSELLYQNARQTYLDQYTADVHYSAVMKIYSNLTEKNI